MHLALCDDEQYQLDHIVTLLEEYREKALPSLRWTTFLTGGALLTAMEQGQHFDAALLDIFMRDLNGMEVARYIRSIDSSIRLLFITSSSDFAVESYRVDASDYLLKPMREYINKYVYAGSRLPEQKIAVATLGNDAGIIGAAFLR